MSYFKCVLFKTPLKYSATYSSRMFSLGHVYYPLQRESILKYYDIFYTIIALIKLCSFIYKHAITCKYVHI